MATKNLAIYGILFPWVDGTDNPLAVVSKQICFCFIAPLYICHLFWIKVNNALYILMELQQKKKKKYPECVLEGNVTVNVTLVF